MSIFQDVKVWLILTLGLSRDALHVYVGLSIFFATAIIFRLSLKDWRVLIPVVLAAIAGEIWDIIDTANLGAPQEWDANWHDIWNTMLWPVVIFSLARWTPVISREK